MDKVVLFAFNAEDMCFLHVLLNALDFQEKGCETKVVIEGAATKLIPQFAGSTGPLASLFSSCQEKDLIAGACLACAKKMKTDESARIQGIPLLDDMRGHAGIARFFKEGYRVITF